MRRKLLLSLFCLCCALFFVRFATATDSLRVNEKASKFLIQDLPTVALEVVNPATGTIKAQLKLELLDPRDNTRGVATRDIALQPGVNKVPVPLTPMGGLLNKDDDDELLWYRLRYRVAPAVDTTFGLGSTSGIISLSELEAPDIFALEVSAPGKTNLGARYYTHVRAFNPLTLKPLKDVQVSVELNLDNDDDESKKNLKVSGVTDDKGYALVTLNLPAKAEADDGELKVVARHGGFIRESTGEVEVSDFAQIMLTTDKPIYQPGQLLHLRALVFDANRHAAANTEATLKVTDPEETTVFETTLQTSRFGVISADWSIPDNTPLGDYRAVVEIDDEKFSDSQAAAWIKISRYDLPNFTVNVKPDQTYYLPQKNAQVEVRADYLFGEPVKRGHVRVIREQEREWNFKEQKWDVEEAEKYEGETDEKGVFTAHINLDEAHKELSDRDYERFDDVHYAAYFTDPTSNRTEQRAFDLRVTKESIHIYVVTGSDQTIGFPFQFFLTTSYADGTPASCDVNVGRLSHDDTPAGVLRTIHTNKYGIAKVSNLTVPVTDWDTNYYHSTELAFVAHNNAGEVGHHTETFRDGKRPVIRVETDKTIYRDGEPIKVNLTASRPELEVIVDVGRDSELIESRSVPLRNGTATFSLPYRPAFQSRVHINAYARDLGQDDSYDTPGDSRTVLFPRPRDLKLNFRLDHTEYKPGADATVDFHVLSPQGKPVNSALGVVVFDRAVEERARTDRDFRGSFGFHNYFNSWQGYDDQIAGITRQSLDEVDLSKPVPPEMELVAELLLASSDMQQRFFDDADFERNHATVFSYLTNRQMKPLNDFLDASYKNSGVYPADGETFRRILFESGSDFSQLRDPWGMPYREVFSTETTNSVMEIMSAGPDKTFGTKDDFSVSRVTTPYFRYTGEAISRAVNNFHARTGGFIRDAETLKHELRSQAIDLNASADPWGQPYRFTFTINRDKYELMVRSGGPDKVFSPTNVASDDFILWIAGIDYLSETRMRVQVALDEYFKNCKCLPKSDGELQRAFTASLVTPDKLVDAWGHSFYAVYNTDSRYADRATIQNVGMYGTKPKELTTIIPVTQQVTSIHLSSKGEDGVAGTPDDFEVTRVSQITAEESTHGQSPTSTFKEVFFSGSHGAIKGTVKDASGAIVPGVKVSAIGQNSSQEYTAETDDAGRFLIPNLPAGLYQVVCDAAGFKKTVIDQVPVNSSNITTVDFQLEVGSISELVTVTSGDSQDINTSSTEVSIVSDKTQISIGRSAQLATPRLREYFPETLVWQPSLETDKQGRAQLKFKLADNITTWKMSVIGSTETGEVGMAETEIKSFQPFFVDHDPPRVLTEGDQISLPVVLRNYLEQAQTVDLEIKPESWFTVTGPMRQRTSVPAGDAARPIFDLTAIASVKDGKQRITARGADASDAIEKPVTVHPDGEEQTQTASEVFSSRASLDLNLPYAVIAGSTQAELKIYPSLMAHVVESIDGILERPHGCGEQTISSTYPSVLLLKRNRQLATSSPIANKALRYTELGYRRLLSYRTEDGGFSYWGHDEKADFALTAYALRFLHDAGEFVKVDGRVVNDARSWLLKQQRGDGSWAAWNYGGSNDDRRDALLTALVARVLAVTQPPTTSPTDDNSLHLKLALSYLSGKIETVAEPYLIASYALAAIDAGDKTNARRAADKLRSLARTEGDTTYWSLETNTPFYGWGMAGRVETSALAIQALARIADAKTNERGLETTDPLIRSGLLFLLKEKDRYGVWYSTQATINVLDTLVSLLARENQTQAASPVEVIVNGQPATSISMPANDQTAALIHADITRFLRSGQNHVELRRAGVASYASVQLVTSYYVPWAAAQAAHNEVPTNKKEDSLRLIATFDKTEAKINDEIVCHVKAERVGFRGYGMMLAEIGLPPGADVDRASLESAVKNSSWSIRQYDVLPDRVVVYLWPAAGGVSFDFKFRPRFALKAKSAPSTIYDYYNPESNYAIAPTSFAVHGDSQMQVPAQSDRAR
ncbi:MAG TPA: alpha-2-macroglobulin family protein [Pyrinomonadaceae bacterium]|nr:alpha-2-macroglobulin family protein [Pyrinomonadaceae bacterium]